METIKRLSQRYTTADKALSNLEQALNVFLNAKQPTLHELLREAVIKRFEYTLELFWKLLKQYMEEIEGATVPASPRGVIAHAKKLDIITDTQAQELNNMIDDRNASSHAYQENIAIKIATDVIRYIPILRSIHTALKQKIG